METVFATVEDYKKRYGEPGDEERCKVLLSDATDQMLSAFEEVYGTYQEGVCAAFDRNAAAVCCLLVNRVLSAPAAMAGATQYSQGRAATRHPSPTAPRSARCTWARPT